MLGRSTTEAGGFDGFYCYSDLDASRPASAPAPSTGSLWLPVARLHALFHCFLRHGANSVERCEHDGGMSALLCPGCGRVFWQKRSERRGDFHARRAAVVFVGAPRNRW